MCSKLFLYLLPLLAFANAEEKTCTVPVEDVDHPNPQEHKFNLTVDLGKINKKEKEWSKIKLTYDVKFTVMKAETDSGSFDAVPVEANKKAWIVERDVNHDNHPFFILKTITYPDGLVNLLKAEIQFNDDEEGEWHELCKEQQNIVEPEIVEPEIVEPEIVEPEKPKYPLCEDFYNITEPFDNGSDCRLGYKGIFYLPFPETLAGLLNQSRIINYQMKVTMSKKVELKINDPEKSYREVQKGSKVKKTKFTFVTNKTRHHKKASRLEKNKTLEIYPFQVNEDGNWSKNCKKSLPKKMEIGKWINRTLTWQTICQGNEN